MTKPVQVTIVFGTKYQNRTHAICFRGSKLLYYNILLSINSNANTFVVPKTHFHFTGRNSLPRRFRNHNRAVLINATKSATLPRLLEVYITEAFVYITLTVVRLSWNISTSLIFVLNSQTLHMNNIELKPLLTIRTKVFCCLMHSNFKVKVEVKDIQSY